MDQHLTPIFEAFGWVKKENGWAYRVAGGTFLMYFGDTIPQTWHLDSINRRCISGFICLTENTAPPEVSTLSAEFRGHLEEMDKRFPGVGIPSLAAYLKKAPHKAFWREFILQEKFLGQDFTVHPSVDGERLQPGDMVFLHTWETHR